MSSPPMVGQVPVGPTGLGTSAARVGRPGADLPTDWMYWFFLFDDWFDGPLGRDPAAVRRLVGVMTDHMMRDWMSANLRWSEETPRYGDWVSEVANDVS